MTLAKQTKMNEIDQPFRPRWDFFLAWAIIEIVTLALTKPWHFDLPWYSIVAYSLVVPFILTICLYGPILFIRQIISSGEKGKQVLSIFLQAVMIVAAVLVIYRLYSGDKIIPNKLVLLVVMGATIYVRQRIRKL